MLVKKKGFTQNRVLFKLQKNEIENQAAHLHWILHSAWKNAQRDDSITKEGSWETNAWVIWTLKSGIKKSEMVKNKFTMHHEVVDQELQWLKSTPTPLLPSFKMIDICPLEHLWAS